VKAWTVICSSGKDAMLFFRAGADVYIYAEVEATRTLQFVPDE